MGGRGHGARTHTRNTASDEPHPNTNTCAHMCTHLLCHAYPKPTEGGLSWSIGFCTYTACTPQGSEFWVQGLIHRVNTAPCCRHQNMLCGIGIPKGVQTYCKPNCLSCRGGLGGKVECREGVKAGFVGVIRMCKLNESSSISSAALDQLHQPSVCRTVVLPPSSPACARANQKPHHISSAAALGPLRNHPTNQPTIQPPTSRPPNQPATRPPNHPPASLSHPTKH